MEVKNVKKRLLNRLDAHFGVCTAMAAAATIAGTGEQANAAIVYSGVVNIPIPNTFSGVYVNLVTNVTSGAGFLTQDINPYYAAANMWMGGDGFNRAVGTAATGPATNVVAGTVISLTTSTFQTTAFPGMGNFVGGTPGLFCLKFRNEVTGVDNVGWVRINRGISPGAGTIVDYAYENAGGTIAAGDTGAGGPVCPSTPLPHPWCAGDITNDNQINTDDLLIIVGSWSGTTVVVPRPAGDVAPLPNGNCQVNTDDLVALIGQWGTCPAPVGACCIPAGTCTPGLLEAQCIAAQGVFKGIGSVCTGMGAVTCTAFPANDNPQGANTLVVGTVAAPNCTNTGNNSTATTVSPTWAVSCTTAVPGRDVWWKYTVPATPNLAGQILSINTCTTADPFNDTILALYTDSDPGPGFTLVEVTGGCNDDTAGCGANGFRSRIAPAVMFPVGSTVYLRLSSWGAAGAAGNYIICASAQDITQDDCLGAETIGIGASDSDALGNATQDFAPTCGRPFASPSIVAGIGKWYKTVGNGNTLTASTCTSTTNVYNGKITVYCGTGCATLLCNAATDANLGQQPMPNPPCAAFQGEQTSWCSVNGGNYWILVHTNFLSTGVLGQYTLSLSTNATPCVSTVTCAPPPPPVNDPCTGAIAIVGTVTATNNALATPTADTPGIMPCINGSRDVWYTYTAATSGSKTVTIGGGAPFVDSILTVYTGTCTGLTSVGCNDDSIGTFSVVTFNATAGTTYIIQLGCWGGTFGGAGSITIAPGL